jgi:flagellin-like hook-associated protein FlgL
MSGIVLSASVRQNLLSLQSTAALLATTQNDLATGNKVNSALDNPTEFFTAQGLNNRASDISNLLDGIGNGVQVLQAANTGITSLQNLIANAQSIANQVLQAPTGYSTKSSVTATAIPGATANNLLGPSSANTVTGTAIPGAAATTTKLSALTTPITTADSLTIDGKTISFTSSGGNTVTSAGGSLDLTNATVGDLLAAVDTITGAASGSSTLSATKLVLSTGTTSPLVIGGAAGTLTALGLTAGTTALTPPAISGQTLQIAATGNGTATNITFGTGSGQVSTLNQLNAALAANNLQAGIDTTGAITISTTNNAASSTIGAFTGSTATQFSSLSAAPPVADPNSQAIRASLISQYNIVLQNINTTAQDSSFNGINLLNGDTLNLTFDETGASKLAIAGVTFNDAGLGLSSLTTGTDFLDSNSANAVLAQLTQASTTLRTAASSLGSNLSIVEIRQDFNKNLINVLQTGASNLTVADPNEEAANSQALSTRQSIAVSALALANQSQQSVLQLLR